MITNEREYRITKAQLGKLRVALESLDPREAMKRVGSRALAKAEHDALESQVRDLAEQVAEYEALKSGAVHILRAASLEELPSILIRARIAKGLSQRAFAGVMGLKEQQIQRYEAESYASASLRRLAEVAKALDIEISEVAELKTDSSCLPCDEGEEILDWSQFPIQEMHRRNWFGDFFSGSVADARNNAEELVREFVRRARPKRAPALLRSHVRAGSTISQYALLAWECRVLSLAKDHPLGKEFEPGLADSEWLRELVRMSPSEEGPKRAIEYVEAAGIPVVIEPHLQQTYLDGAALRLPGVGPVVGLTLRYDRLDNFWFVLVHELVHVMRHLQKGKTEEFFDDLDAEPDALESEADQLASDALIPNDAWETALARYVRTQESISELAKELQISPAIIAGRIRREADNHALLADMVGQGQVRRLFPEVSFGQ